MNSLYKKAQIGATLTWMLAFIVIFFVMILYASSAGILASQKLLKGDKNEIIFSEGLGNLYEQRNLIGILNSPEGNEKILDLIVKWNLGKINDVDLSDKIKVVLDEKSNGEDCYSMEIESEGKNLKIGEFNQEIVIMTNLGTRYRSREDFVLISKLTIYPEIKIMLYKHDC